MAGGIYKSQPFALNIKCIVISIIFVIKAIQNTMMQTESSFFTTFFSSKLALLALNLIII